MKDPEEKAAAPRNARPMILQQIDAAIELAEKKGKHPLTRGCNCIHCAQRRKRLLQGPVPAWKYTL